MSDSGRGQRVRNPILRTLVTAKGNQAACLWTEPMWGLPFNLFTPLAAVYMAALGLNPFQIGTITTVSLVSQMITASFAGVITDKFGRRLATALFDILAWVIPSILWATAQGYWSFFAAAVFNGFWRVTDNSWGLLLTEDAEPSTLMHLYTISNIAGLLAGFVSPLTYMFVRQYSLITTMRWLYVVMATSMAIKCLLLYLITHETEVGKRRRLETKDKSIFSSLFESRFVLRRMLSSRRIMLTVALSTCFILIRSVNDNFWPLLITEKLGVSQETLSLFSTLKTLVMLLMFFVLVPRLDVRVFLKPFTIAMGLIVAVNLVLFFLQQGAMQVIVIGIVLEALALSALLPMMPTLIMQAMEKEERARMLALATMMALMVSAPFGTLAGWLSKLNRSLPMLLNVSLAALSIFLAPRLAAEMDKSQELAS